MTKVGIKMSFGISVFVSLSGRALAEPVSREELSLIQVIESPMLKYSPPKARLWGHQVSRHTATAVLQLCEQFVNEFCNINPPPPFEVEPDRLYLMYQLSNAELVDPLVMEIEALLGSSYETNDSEMQGAMTRMQTWHHHADQVPALAAFYDRHAAVFKKRKAYFTASRSWFFSWRDDESSEPINGHFNCHISTPLVVGTHFNFRDFKHYEAIKEHFLQIGLFEMSEKHLTPKALVKEYMSKKL